MRHPEGQRRRFVGQNDTLAFAPGETTTRITIQVKGAGSGDIIRNSAYRVPYGVPRSLSPDLRMMSPDP
jgi:hypothetical protein